MSSHGESSRQRRDSPDRRERSHRDEGSSSRRDRDDDRKSRDHESSRRRERSRSRDRDRDSRRDRDRDSDRKEHRRRRSPSRSRSRSRSPERGSSSRHKHRSSRRRSPSSGSSSGSDSDDSRRHKHRKSSHRDDDERDSKGRTKEERREKRQRKKEKLERREKKKKGIPVVEWGKHGIIAATDIYTKDQEFRAWLVGEKMVNPETLAKAKEKEMFLSYMEEYNTGTLPHEKYYDMDKYEKKMTAVRMGETIDDSSVYDPNKDLEAVRSSHRRKPVETETFLDRSKLEELAKINRERVEMERMKRLGMEAKQSMGVRMDYKI